MIIVKVTTSMQAGYPITTTIANAVRKPTESWLNNSNARSRCPQLCADEIGEGAKFNGYFSNSIDKRGNGTEYSCGCTYDMNLW